MKNNKWEQVPQSNEPYVCLYCVAFIDILGIREAMRPFLNNDYIFNNTGREEFDEIFGDQVAFIKLFRQSFKNCFNNLGNEEYRIHLSVISDSVIVYVPLGEDIYSNNNHSQVIQGIYYLMASCGLMFLQTVYVKKIFRAGIDLGWGAQLNKEEIFGPGLIKAYELEKNEAKYPRIIIGNSLYDYLNKQKLGNRTTENQTEKDINDCKNWGAKCLSLLKKDYDEKQIIDYLNKDFGNGLDVKTKVKSFFRCISLFMPQPFASDDKPQEAYHKSLRIDEVSGHCISL